MDAGADQTNYIEVQASSDSDSGSSDCPGTACTLRDAVDSVNFTGSGDIDFASTVSTVSLNPASGTLTLSANGETIVAPGASHLTVNGNGSSSSQLSVFSVDSGVQALFYGITITGGNNPRGGGVLNRGTVTLLDSVVENNTASGIPGYGGIFNLGTLTAIGSTLSGNTAPGFGGGILNEGTATLTDTTVSANSASGGRARHKWCHDGTVCAAMRSESLGAGPSHLGVSLLPSGKRKALPGELHQ